MSVGDVYWYLVFVSVCAMIRIGIIENKLDDIKRLLEGEEEEPAPPVDPSQEKLKFDEKIKRIV
jgi:hypothetical protein